MRLSETTSYIASPNYANAHRARPRPCAPPSRCGVVINCLVPHADICLPRTRLSRSVRLAVLGAGVVDVVQEAAEIG